MSERQQLDARPSGDVLPVADRCEIVRDFAKLEALAADWDRLWDGDDRGEIFQSFLWARAWWGACGRTVELCTPVVYAGSDVLGILPLIVREGRLEFLGSPHADYGDVICAEAASGQVLEWSFRTLQKQGGWREGLLDGLPAESRIVRHAVTMPASVRGDLQLIAAETCYAIRLGDQAAEILDGLARKQHLRRRQNKLEKAGKVAFRHLESVPEALQHLELFFVCQRRRRAIHGKSSAAESEEFRQLLRNLIREFDLKQRLHFGVLELNGRPLAWHLSFEVHDKLVFYQQTFEVDAWDFAPGEALLRYLLLFAKGRVGREFDFTRGDEPFKARFSNHERTVYRLWLQRPGLLGGMTGAARRAEGQVRGAIGKLRTTAKKDKGFFERWRTAQTWLRERGDWIAGKGKGADSETGGGRSSVRGMSQGRTIAVFESGYEREGRARLADEARVRSGGLGELVDFAQENPRVISPTKILSLRERFRKGDQVWIEWHLKSPVRVAWAATRDLREVIELPEDSPEVEKAMIVYEVWEAQAGKSGDLSPMLDRLVAESDALRLPLWICCVGDSALKVEVERRGLRKKYEIRRRGLLGRLLRGGAVGTERKG